MISGKGLATLDIVQVWDIVWTDTDLQGDHLRMLKSQDEQGVRGEKLVNKWEKTQSCLKLPELARKF